MMDSMYEERPAMKAHEYRKIVKPLLERRRRARINHCLGELKTLLMESNNTLEGTEASRLEKADILELTVKHLKDSRNWHHRRTPNDSPEFRLGFTECASEVAACITTLPGITFNVRNQLINRLTGRQGTTAQVTTNAPTPPPSPCTPTHPLDLTAKEENVQIKLPAHWRPW